MTAYDEEQEQELEALESIYPEELEILSREKPISFQIAVKSQLEDPFAEAEAKEVGDSNGEIPDAECLLKFVLPETYPDALPEIEVVDPEESNLDETDVKGLLDKLKEDGEENVGMAMIFTLVSVALDWLTQNHEDKMTKAKEEKDRKQTEFEEAERKRFEGTRVTVETFMAWKMKFDAELAELKRIEEKKREAEGKTGGGGNLTGKELFSMNADLDDSDIKFLGGDDGGGGGGGEDAVAGGGGGGGEVDETLFQDLEDLDFDDDDDEDFDPDMLDDDDDWRSAVLMSFEERFSRAYRFQIQATTMTVW